MIVVIEGKLHRLYVSGRCSCGWPKGDGKDIGFAAHIARIINAQLSNHEPLRDS